MTQNGLKRILNRSLKKLNFEKYLTFWIFFFIEGFPKLGSELIKRGYMNDDFFRFFIGLSIL